MLCANLIRFYSVILSLTPLRMSQLSLCPNQKLFLNEAIPVNIKYKTSSRSDPISVLLEDPFLGQNFKILWPKKLSDGTKYVNGN